MGGETNSAKVLEKEICISLIPEQKIFVARLQWFIAIIIKWHFTG